MAGLHLLFRAGRDRRPQQVQLHRPQRRSTQRYRRHGTPGPARSVGGQPHAAAWGEGCQWHPLQLGGPLHPRQQLQQRPVQQSRHTQRHTHDRWLQGRPRPRQLRQHLGGRLASLLLERQLLPRPRLQDGQGRRQDRTRRQVRRLDCEDTPRQGRDTRQARRPIRPI